MTAFFSSTIVKLMFAHRDLETAASAFAVVGFAVGEVGSSLSQAASTLTARSAPQTPS